MGLVQKETKGRADPVSVRSILQELTSWRLDFFITDPESNRGMCDFHERQNDGDLYENADTQSNHVHQIFCGFI